MEAQVSEGCTECQKPYNQGSNIRLTQSCGHIRCLACINQRNQCRLCLKIAAEHYRDVLISQRKELVAKLNIQDGLMDELIAKKVLDDRCKNRLTSDGSKEKMAQRLIEYLNDRSTEDISMFVQALTNTNQAHLADLFTQTDVFHPSKRARGPDSPKTSKRCKSKDYEEKGDFIGTEVIDMPYLHIHLKVNTTRSVTGKVVTSIYDTIKTRVNHRKDVDFTQTDDFISKLIGLQFKEEPLRDSPPAREVTEVIKKETSIDLCVHCHTLPDAEDLWKMYESHELDKSLQSTYVTDECKRTWGIDRVRMNLEIDDQEYEMYRRNLLHKGLPVHMNSTLEEATTARNIAALHLEANIYRKANKYVERDELDKLENFIELFKQLYTITAAVPRGSVMVVLKCATVADLDILIERYRDGQLRKAFLQKFGNEALREELNRGTVSFSVYIDETTYKQYRELLCQHEKEASGTQVIDKFSGDEDLRSGFAILEKQHQEMQTESLMELPPSTDDNGFPTGEKYQTDLKTEELRDVIPPTSEKNEPHLATLSDKLVAVTEMLSGEKSVKAMPYEVFMEILLWVIPINTSSSLQVIQAISTWLEGHGFKHSSYLLHIGLSHLHSSSEAVKNDIMAYSLRFMTDKGHEEVLDSVIDVLEPKEALYALMSSLQHNPSQDATRILQKVDISELSPKEVDAIFADIFERMFAYGHRELLNALVATLSPQDGLRVVLYWLESSQCKGASDLLNAIQLEGLDMDSLCILLANGVLQKEDCRDIWEKMAGLFGPLFSDALSWLDSGEYHLAKFHFGQGNQKYACYLVAHGIGFLRGRGQDNMLTTVLQLLSPLQVFLAVSRCLSICGYQGENELSVLVEYEKMSRKEVKSHLYPEN